MTRTSGIRIAPSAAASTMRCRSRMLAKRHRPRYRPSARKIVACSGRIHTSVNHASPTYGSRRSRLKRSQKIAIHASAAAQVSWTNASEARQLKPRVIKEGLRCGQFSAPMIINRREQDEAYNARERECIRSPRRAEEQTAQRGAHRGDHQQRVRRQGAGMARAQLVKALVVMVAVRREYALAAGNPPDERRCRVRQEPHEHQQ